MCVCVLLRTVLSLQTRGRRLLRLVVKGSVHSTERPNLSDLVHLPPPPNVQRGAATENPQSTPSQHTRTVHSACVYEGRDTARFVMEGPSHLKSAKLTGSSVILTHRHAHACWPRTPFPEASRALASGEEKARCVRGQRTGDVGFLKTLFSVFSASLLLTCRNHHPRAHPHQRGRPSLIGSWVPSRGLFAPRPPAPLRRRKR